MRSENKRYVYPYPRKAGIKTTIKNIYAIFLRIYYRIIYLFVRFRGKRNYKYQFTVCAIFKNESPYLREWIIYHQLIGTEHFYLYNNNSEDDYAAVLAPFIRSGVVTLINWQEDQAQLKAYKDCITKRKEEAHWIAFVDLDEFIVPIKNDTVMEWLGSFSNRPSVKLNWRVFGTSGLLDRDMSTLVSESFTSCWDKIDMVGKCLLNNDFSFDFESRKNHIFHHMLWGQWHGIDIPPVNCFGHICLDGYEWAGTNSFPIIMNHYFTKSVSEYIQKSGKGDVFSEINPHTMDYMWAHERRCVNSDFSIFKYISRIKIELGKTK